MDLRQRVLTDCDAGISTSAVAAKYRVCTATVRRWKQRRREHGELGPRKAGNPQPPRWHSFLEQLDELVAAQPDATLTELREALGGELSVTDVWRALRALGCSYKKSHSRR
jgi:transposase